MGHTPEDFGTEGFGSGGDGAATVHSVAGGWLGTYYYWGREAGQPPCRFEATFRELAERDRFGGTILDDGPLGEAVVEKGVQQGRHVRFTKVYLEGDLRTGIAPVRYVGTLSEDGRLMHGTWSLAVLRGASGRRVTASGVWEARRLWSAAEEEAAEPEAEGASAARELAGAGAGER